MKKSNNPVQNNKPNYSSKTIVMKNLNLLSKLAGIILLLVVTVQIAAAGNPQTPYQQLQNILDEYGIEKYAVTDELTATEVEYISSDVAIQFKVPEVVVKNTTTVGEMLTNILKYQYAGKKGIEWEWKKIQYSSNPDDYDWFMRSHPKSKHSMEAMSKYMVTRLNEIFISLAEADSIDEICKEYLSWYLKYSYYYEHYIRKYDCGGCGIQCIDYEGFSYINPKEWEEVIQEYLHDKTKEQQAWKAAVRENTHDAYWSFLMEYPQSTTTDTAFERIKKIEQSEWDKALEHNNRKAYEEFIEHFPQGYYSNDAYRKIVQDCLDTISSEAEINDLEKYCEYDDHAGYSLICIGNINNDGKSYTVTLTGDLGYRMTLKPGEHKWLEVLDGKYQILIEADGTTPHWGTVNCFGYVYAQAWYIHTYNPLFPELPRQTRYGDRQSHCVYESEVDREAEQRFNDAVSTQCDLTDIP